MNRFIESVKYCSVSLVRLDPTHTARNTLLRTEIFKPPAAKTYNPAFFGSCPQIMTSVLKQRDKTIVRNARRIAFVESRKLHTVKSRQAVHGCQPEIAVAGLNDPINRILRQPVIRRPLIDPVLSPNGDVAQTKTKDQSKVLQ